MVPNRVRIGSRPDARERGWLEDSASNEDAPRTSTRPETHWTLRRKALLFAATVLLLAVAGAAAFGLLVDAEALAERIAPKASATLNRRIDVGSARLTLLPRMGVRLEDVRVANLAGFDGPPIAGLDRLDLGVALFPLLRGRVELTGASARGVRLHVGIDQGGTSNFGDLVPSGDTGPAGAADDRVRFELRRVTLDDVSLSYLDVPGHRSLSALGGAGSLRVLPGRNGTWLIDIDGASDSLLVRLGGETQRIARLGGPELALRVAGNQSLDRIAIEAGRLDHEGFTLDVAGRLEGLNTGRPRVELHLTNGELDAAALVTLLSEHRRADLPALAGALDVGLFIAGPLGEGGPVLRGTVGLADVSIRLGNETLADSVRGRLRIAEDSVHAEGIRGVFAGGRFTLGGAAARADGSGRWKLSANPDLAQLARLELDPAGVDATGDAIVEATVSGSLTPLRIDELEGTVELVGVRAELRDLDVPVYVAAATLSVEDGRVRWPATEVLYGEQRLSSEGELTAELATWWRGRSLATVESRVSGEHLDLGTVLPFEVPSGMPTYPHIAFASAGRRELDGRSARVLADARGFRRPASLPLRGTVSMDFASVVYHGLTLDSLTARVTFGDSVLAIEDVGLGAWGGHVSGLLELGISDAPDAPFTLALRGSTLRAGEALDALTPLGSAVSGTADLEVELTGSVDENLLPVPALLKGGARVDVTHGSWSGTAMNHALADFLATDAWASIPFESWATALRIDGSGMGVEHSRLEGPFARLSAAGAIDLGGPVELSLGLLIPPDRLHQLSLRRTGVAESVLASLQAAKRPLVLGLRVGGSLAGPTLEPDALAAEEVVVSR